MAHTRELHVVSGELNILKRTLSPLYNMINALRDHQPGSRGTSGGYFSSGGVGGNGHNTPHGGSNQPKPTSDLEEKTHGADISPAARIYLADVADHVLILTEEIDMLRGTVENMITMVVSSLHLLRQIFNMVASTQNESMRQLTMASLIFLPLTFITGYFGMNFNTDHWSVLVDNGPEYFWEIALPATVFVLCLLMYSYIRRLMKTLGRQIVRRGVRIKLRKNREMRRHRGAGGVRRYDTSTKLQPLTEPLDG
jgi:Mg2+ and Co2+ transporter CorA